MMNFEILVIELDHLDYLALELGPTTHEIYDELWDHYIDHCHRGHNKTCILCKDFERTFKILSKYRRANNIGS